MQNYAKKMKYANNCAKIAKVWLINAILVVCFGSASAQTRQLIGFSPEVGLVRNHLVGTDNGYALGPVCGMSLNVEIQHQHLRFQTGVGAQAHWAYPPKEIAADTVSSQRVTIPMLLGGQWGHFYMLAGPQLHYIHEQEWNIGLSAHVELGTELGFVSNETGYGVPRRRDKYKVGLYVERLILHQHGQDIVDPTKQWYVGAKATILFDITQGQNSKIWHSNIKPGSGKKVRSHYAD